MFSLHVCGFIYGCSSAMLSACPYLRVHHTQVTARAKRPPRVLLVRSTFHSDPGHSHLQLYYPIGSVCGSQTLRYTLITSRQAGSLFTWLSPTPAGRPSRLHIALCLSLLVCCIYCVCDPWYDCHAACGPWNDHRALCLSPRTLSGPSFSLLVLLQTLFAYSILS